MFRPMRRRNKEISADDLKKLLVESRRGVLAVNGDNGYPYAIPVNYCYDETEQKIYFHGARVGHKAESLKSCSKVCFTVYGNEALKDEPWAPYLQSAVIFGRCTPIQDEKQKYEKFRQLAAKYYPDEDTIEEEIAVSGKAACMYEIAIEHITGKQIQER